jgi:hypothetical protein
VQTLTRAYINDQRHQNRYQNLSRLIQNLYLRYQTHQSLNLRYLIHQSQNRLNQSHCPIHLSQIQSHHFLSQSRFRYRYQNQCHYRGSLCQILRCHHCRRLRS